MKTINNSLTSIFLRVTFFDFLSFHARARAHNSAAKRQQSRVFDYSVVFRS